MHETQPRLGVLGHHRRGLGDPQVVCDGHDDRVRQAAGIEGDPVVRRDGFVQVQLKRQDRPTEWWHGARHEAGEFQEFLRGAPA